MKILSAIALTAALLGPATAANADRPGTPSKCFKTGVKIVKIKHGKKTITRITTETCPGKIVRPNPPHSRTTPTTPTPTPSITSWGAR